MRRVGGILRRVPHFPVARRAVEAITAATTTAAATTTLVTLTVAFFTTRVYGRCGTRARDRSDAAIGRVDFQLATLELRDLEQSFVGRVLHEARELRHAEVLLVE